MYVTRSHKGVDVRFVWLRRHRITQKYDAIDGANRQAGADLQISTHRATEHTLHGQAQFAGQSSPRGTGCRQLALTEKRQKLSRQIDHVGLLVVVCNQCNSQLHK